MTRNLRSSRFIPLSTVALPNKIETLEEDLKKYQQVTLAELQTIAKKLSRENLYAYWIE